MKFLKAIFLSCFILITSCVPVFAAEQGYSMPVFPQLTISQQDYIYSFDFDSYNNLTIFTYSNTLYIIPAEITSFDYYNQAITFGPFSGITVSSDGTIGSQNSPGYKFTLGYPNYSLAYLKIDGIQYVNLLQFPASFSFGLDFEISTRQVTLLEWSNYTLDNELYYRATWQAKQSIIFNDYYTGSIYIDLPKNIIVDGAEYDDNLNQLKFTDCKQIDFYNNYYTLTTSFPSNDNVLAGGVPIESNSITGWFMLRSRPYESYVQKIVDAVGQGLETTNDLIENGTSESQQANDDFQNQNNDLNDDVTDYNDFQDDQVHNMETAMQQVDTSPDLFTFEGFANSASWLSSQLVNLYNTHASIQVMTGFGLVVGLALMIIGRRWR